MCSNWDFVGLPGRLPNGLLGVLLKEYWPGLYKPNEEREERVLALRWVHYEAAKHSAYQTHANVVVTNFWVSFL